MTAFLIAILIVCMLLTLFAALYAAHQQGLQNMFGKKKK